MQLDWTMFKDPVTSVCAIIGASLGVVNSVQGFRQRRVCLRVIPRVVSIRQGGFLYSTNELIPYSVPCIEVVNLSSFPVTIREVGFTLHGTEQRAVLLPSDVKKLPSRLNSRESVTVHAGEKAVLPRNIKKCYAKTECDETRFGDSPVLKKLRESLV